MGKVKIKHEANGTSGYAPVWPMCANTISPLCRQFLNPNIKHSSEEKLKIKHENE